MIYNYIMCHFGHQDLFNERISQEEIVNFLSKFQLEETLDFLTKIEIVLLNLPKSQNKTDSQTFLIINLLPKSALTRIMKKIKEFGEILIFNRGQLTLLRKLALIHCQNKKTENTIWDQVKTATMSRILLGATDIYLANEVVTKSKDKSEIMKNATQLSIKSHYINRRINVMKLMVQSYLMFEKLTHKIKHTIGKYKNLNLYLKNHIGVDFITMLSFSFGLISPYYSDINKVVSSKTVLNIEKMFMKTNFTPQTQNIILEKMSISLSNLKNKIQKENYQNFGFNRSTFTKYPLLKLSNNKVICLDLLALIEKFTINFSWIDGFNKELLTFKGYCFQEYLKYIIQNYCIKLKHLTYQHLTNQGKSNEEWGDSLIFSKNGEQLIIFEAKAKHFKEEFKSSGNLNHIIPDIVEDAKQLDIAITKIVKNPENSGFKKPPKQIFPVLVYYENIPTDFEIQDILRKKIHKEGFLTDTNIEPVSIVSIKEIEEIFKHNTDILKLLQKKFTENKNSPTAGLGNYFYKNKNNKFDKKWLKAEEDEMLRKLSKYYPKK